MNKLYTVTLNSDQSLRVNEVCNLNDIGSILITEILEINGSTVKFLGLAVS